MAASIALCMLVKDEANNIEACVAAVRELVDEIVIFDTGSTDGTPEILERRFGIRVLHDKLDLERCLTKMDVRNRAFDLARTDWILSLDADERMHPAGLQAFREMRHDPRTSGYFGLWRNHVAQDPAFDDYKCFIFRRGFRMRGLVHENAQVDIREKGGHAEWLHGLEVAHHPEYIKHHGKTLLYGERLNKAIVLEPHWTRYHWFLGYLQSQLGHTADAMRNLATAFETAAPLFPVERLNSAMVLADLHCRTGRTAEARAILERAAALHDAVRGDFEVAINTRMRPWIDGALALVRAGRAGDVQAYRFAR